MLTAVMVMSVQPDYPWLLKSLTKPKLLVIDECGHKQVRDRDHEHFYDVTAGRNQSAFTLITSNLP